ncbi:hypothetical protein [Curtobacterium sp. ISL-83]|uniref:hypothetical protein n=1 Tax=Curtobacterium sp. ISL-83 TaxID=2819145 RepID=UPI0035AB7898
MWRLDRPGRSIWRLTDQLQALGERASVPFLAGDDRHLAAARTRGRTGGRRPRLSVDQVRTARRLYEQQDMTVAHWLRPRRQPNDGVSALRRESEADPRRPGRTNG